MIIAIPFAEDRVFQHFGKSEQFKLYDLKTHTSQVLSTNGQGHSSLCAWLMEQHADIVLCGGIGSGAVQMLRQNGIRVYPGNSGFCDVVLLRYAAGLLQEGDSTCSHHHEGDCGEHGCK